MISAILEQPAVAKRIFLGLGWLGVLSEALFILGAYLSGSFGDGAIVMTPYLSFVSPLTLSSFLLSGFLLSWWLANRRAGVPCYRQMIPVSAGHAVCVSVIALWGLSMILTRNSAGFLGFIVFAPLVGETAVLTGLLIVVVRGVRARPQYCGPVCS